MCFFCGCKLSGVGESFTFAKLSAHAKNRGERDGVDFRFSTSQMHMVGVFREVKTFGERKLCTFAKLGKSCASS